MIFTSMKVSAAGGEYSFFTQDREKITISAADAKKLSLFDLTNEDLPVTFDDDELIRFLSHKLSAIKYCTYLMSFSDKSESALRLKMREKGYVGDVADEALRILRESGYTDDESLCAKKYISIANSKLYGPHRIKSELLAKGFSSHDINKAQDVCDVDFEELLCELVEKLLKSKRPDFSDRNELMKFKAKLSRYGYSFDVINTVLSRYSDMTEDTDEYPYE